MSAQLTNRKSTMVQGGGGLADSLPPKGASIGEGQSGKNGNLLRASANSQIAGNR